MAHSYAKPISLGSSRGSPSRTARRSAPGGRTKAGALAKASVTSMTVSSYGLPRPLGASSLSRTALHSLARKKGTDCLLAVTGRAALLLGRIVGIRAAPPCPKRRCGRIGATGRGSRRRREGAFDASWRSQPGKLLRPVILTCPAVLLVRARFIQRTQLLPTESQFSRGQQIGELLGGVRADDRCRDRWLVDQPGNRDGGGLHAMGPCHGA